MLRQYADFCNTYSTSDQVRIFLPSKHSNSLKIAIYLSDGCCYLHTFVRNLFAIGGSQRIFSISNVRGGLFVIMENCYYSVGGASIFYITYNYLVWCSTCLKQKQDDDENVRQEAANLVSVTVRSVSHISSRYVNYNGNKSKLIWVTIYLAWLLRMHLGSPSIIWRAITPPRLHTFICCCGGWG